MGGVAQAVVLPDGGLGRLVGLRTRGDAGDVPAAHVDAVVGLRTVGAGDDRLVVGGDEHEAAEGDLVADQPGGDDDGAGEDARAGQHGASGAGGLVPGPATWPPAPGPPGHRDEQEGHEQQRLGAGERRQADDSAEHERAADGGAVIQREGGEQHAGDERAVEDLAHEVAVDRDHHRIDGVEQRGENADSVPTHPAADAAAEQPHEHERDGPEDQPQRALDERAVAAEEVQPREQDRVQGRVGRRRPVLVAGQQLPRVGEAVPVDDQARLPVVEPPVADADHVAGRPVQVGGAQDQPESGDGGQATGERARSHGGQHRVRRGHNARL